MPQVAIKHIKPGDVVEIPAGLLSTSKPIQGVWTYATQDPNFKDAIRATLVVHDKELANRFASLLPMNQDKTLEVVENSELPKWIKATKPDPSSIQTVSGCDPEIFVTGAQGLIPAWEYLPAKDKAVALLGGSYGSFNGDYMSYEFWDGFQAEFCPFRAMCLEVLHDHIRTGLQKVRRAARTYKSDAELSLLSSIEVPETYLKNASDDNVIFRCSPSMNVYHDLGGQIPNPREYKYRFAGGHLHFGNSSKWTAPMYGEIIRALDGILGVAGVSLAAGFDTPDRRTMYGRAGEFRLPAHGIEYRVLSNFWLCHPAISQLVHELFRRTITFAVNGFYSICWEADQEEVRRVINSCDVAGARAILAKNAGILEWLFAMPTPSGARWQPALVKNAVQTILNGLYYAIEEPNAIAKNWCLEGSWMMYGRQANAQWSNLQLPRRSVVQPVQALGSK